jgi:hypothetical protein
MNHCSRHYTYHSSCSDCRNARTAHGSGNFGSGSFTGLEPFNPVSDLDMDGTPNVIDSSPLDSSSGGMFD